MKLSTKNTFLLAALLASQSDAFSTPSVRTLSPSTAFVSSRAARAPFQKTSSTSLFVKDEEVDEEIDRLKSMASKLRAEAASLEAEQAQSLADAAEKAFRKFDTNQDGQISLEELKEGLEKVFKMELPEKRVRKLMEDFDKSGDGTLQLEEFVTVDRFRNKLDALAREEKALAQEMTKAAQIEEEASKLLQAQLDMINDRPPTGPDKLVSILPYLFPLLDGLQFARFLVVENPDSPVSALIALVYALYRSIPFGGFIAFFALSFLSGNPSINRLIRFNMQQAIYLDIALFFPGLLAALYSLVGNAAGFSIPAAATELGSDFLFFSLLATVGYAVVSSLLGQTPDKIPFISGAVNDRMPTVDMFDAEGRFQPRQKRDEKKEDEDKKD